MPVKHEFSISEMARLFDIKRDTLLYYDRIGLFSPNNRKDNNYRTYTVSQLQLLDTIINLRDLGIPIKTIREFTKKRSPESFIALADEAVENIEDEILKLRKRAKVLKSTVEEIRPAKSFEYGKVEITHLKKIPISLSKEGDYSASMITFDKPYEDFMAAFSIPWTETAGLKFGIANLKKNNYAKSSQLFSRNGMGKNAEIEEGLYALSYFKCRWQDCYPKYKKMLKDIKDLGYEATGPCYEEYPIAHLVEEDERNFVTKISIKVEKRD